MNINFHLIISQT